MKLIIKIPEGKKQDLENICNAISDSDSSFKFTIENDRLIVYCKDEKDAFKKGGWFKYKCSKKIHALLKFEVDKNEDKQG